MGHPDRCCLHNAAYRGLGGAARGGRRAGFTLLEMILALSLGVALIVTIYVAASLHLRMADRGPATVEYTRQVQVALDRLGDDLRHVLATPPSVTAGGMAPQEQSPSAEEGGGETESDTPAVGAVPYGLWGDVDALVLYRVIRPLDLDLADALLGQGIQVPRPAVYRVTYSLLEERDEQGQVVYGLYRSQVPAGFEVDADELPIDPAAYPHYQRLLGNVVLLQFSYFDGLSWLDAWGDLDPVEPPVAVEVVLGVVPPPEVHRVSARTTALAQTYGLPPGTDAFRLVVRIPVADPAAALDVSEATSF